MLIDLSTQATQLGLAQLVGVTQPTISNLMTEGKIPATGTLADLLHAYCQRLRDQAAGRLGSETGGLDLVQERAALAREQRISQALKNSIARGEYAPIGVLADVLGMASSAVVDRMDQLEGALRKACPDLPEEARDTVMQVIASARNEWVRSTAKLVTERVDSMGDADGQDLEDGAHEAHEEEESNG